MAAWGGGAQEGADMAVARRGMAAVLVVTAAMTFFAGGIAVAKRQANTTRAAIAAFEVLVTQLNNYHYSAAWQTLNPTQQAMVPRSVYVKCAATDALVISDVKVIRSSRESFRIPGTKMTAPSVALKVRATYTSGGVGETTMKTFHETYVDGSWRWTLTSPESYSSNC